MRVKSGFIQLFREGLLMEDFVEINTPKLISGESEGGADVFRTDYFGQVPFIVFFTYYYDYNINIAYIIYLFSASMSRTVSPIIQTNGNIFGFKSSI
jgi:aspartyl/asparaginyl-tRNA synthetase